MISEWLVGHRLLVGSGAVNQPNLGQERRWLSDGRKSWNCNGFSSAVPSLQLPSCKLLSSPFYGIFFYEDWQFDVEEEKSIDRIMLMTLIWIWRLSPMTLVRHLIAMAADLEFRNIDKISSGEFFGELIDGRSTVVFDRQRPRAGTGL